VKAADDCCGGGRDVTSPRASSFSIASRTFAACCHIILERIAGNYCFSSALVGSAFLKSDNSNHKQIRHNTI